MKRLFSDLRMLGLAVAATAILPLAAPPLGAQAPTPAAATSGPVAEAVAALRAITTLRADFTQTDRNGQRTTGVLTLRQPGRIRFQYAPGIPLLIVSDGRALTLIDYEVRQVQRWPIGNSPLGALLDPRRDVVRYGRLQPTGDPNVISIEVRDPARPEYGVITLIFVRKAGAPGGLELVSWVALDSQNKRTTIRLANHRYGIPLPDNAFRWTDPRGSTRR
jgi:outer membrane lipoprotein-sorting protein